MNDRVELRLNQSGNDLMKRYPDRFSVSRHPAGLNFYTADWSDDARGTVIIGQPNHIASIRYVLGVTGSDDSNFPSEQITNWKITAGIDDTSLIGHDEARRRFFGILQSLRDAGWTRSVRLSEPRLNGEAALRYRQLKARIYSLDPSYVLPLNEWMTLKDGATWSFYADHSYLDISITRDPSRSDPEKPGAYFIEYSLRSENERWRDILDSSKQLNWKAELPAAITAQNKLRKAAEDALKEEHIAIDESYRDPPLPDLNH